MDKKLLVSCVSLFCHGLALLFNFFSQVRDYMYGSVE